MSPAQPVPAELVVDRFAASQTLLHFAQLEQQLSGAHPFVRSLQVDVPCAAGALLPAGAAIERCVTTDNSVHLLARTATATIVIESSPRATAVRVAAVCHLEAERVAGEIRDRVPEPDAGSIAVRVWHHEGEGGRSADRQIEASAWTAIEQNYPSASRPSIGRLMQFVRPVGVGKLILWHGPPGTGKTTALRALMRTWAPWCQPQYIADPEQFFGKPAYMAQVLTTAPNPMVGPALHRAGQPESVWRLVIAEDADEYLRASARRDTGAALGRLLNLADGILGQGMNVLVLLTTNEEVARLHPAIVRPGRCLAAVEFPPFPAQEAARWLQAPAAAPATLAELLQRRGTFGEADAPATAASPTGQYL